MIDKQEIEKAREVLSKVNFENYGYLCNSKEGFEMLEAEQSALQTALKVFEEYECVNNALDEQNKHYIKLFNENEAHIEQAERYKKALETTHDMLIYVKAYLERMQVKNEPNNELGKVLHGLKIAKSALEKEAK